MKKKRIYTFLIISMICWLKLVIRRWRDVHPKKLFGALYSYGSGFQFHLTLTFGLKTHLNAPGVKENLLLNQMNVAAERIFGLDPQSFDIFSEWSPQQQVVALIIPFDETQFESRELVGKMTGMVAAGNQILTGL